MWYYRIRHENLGSFSWSRSRGIRFHKGLVGEIDTSGVTDFSSTTPLTEDTLPTDILSLSGPLVLGFLVTNYCNLQCTYCFSEPLHVTTDTVSNPVAQGVAQSICALEPLAVWLSGGEPTLVIQLPEVIRTFSMAGIPSTLDTNGTLLTEELISVLQSTHLCDVRVSLDCHEPAIHNSHRGLARETMAGLQRLLELGIRVAVQTVLTRKNAKYLSTMYAVLGSMGIEKWIIQDLVAAGWAVDRYDELSIPEDTLNTMLSQSQGAGHLPRIIHVKGNYPRSTALVDDSGHLYTVSGRERIIAGNLLQTDPHETWQRLPLDFTAYTQKYVSTHSE